jgi:rare lipoprotein A (peptidoglycan hydrolase)
VIDRGPYAGHRVMDLSREAARRLGIILGGLAFVQCTIIPKMAK